ncbi:amino acid ABC transporter permease [Campylobacter lari]|uniref:amino acid ABC transporter permease n=1 Tax=Campylobacter lari TaxID=201 RepID=UPI00069B2050|nr:amino acid ABC transporter permease [Campylobacter lari]
MNHLFIVRSKFNEHKKNNLKVFLFNAFLLVFLLFLFFYLSFLSASYNFDFGAIYEYKDKMIQGFFTSFFISVLSLIVGVIFALILCYMSLCKIVLFNMFARVFIELIRGTPLLVQILLIYYIFADNLGLDNRYVCGVLILALFASAYICEIFRAGILSVDKMQYESAKALGLSEFEIYKSVIFPQALKNILAPLSGQLSNLIKDSSLLSVIAISELTQNAQEINAFTFSTLEIYIPLALCYLVLTLPISMFSRKLEKSFS